MRFIILALVVLLAGCATAKDRFAAKDDGGQQAQARATQDNAFSKPTPSCHIFGATGTCY
jgi:uncharacterized protein YceK